MHEIPWGTTAAVFLGTLPLLGVLAWNLMEVKTFRAEVRAEFTQIRAELAQLRAEITNIRERLAMIDREGRAWPAGTPAGPAGPGAPPVDGRRFTRAAKPSGIAIPAALAAGTAPPVPAAGARLPAPANRS